MGTLIEYKVDGGVAIIELNDPPANTYSYEMMLEIDSAVLSARMDPHVHVIVLRGMGEKFFCAGANIGMLKDADPDFKYYFCLHASETLLRLEQTPKLVIAALNGHTVGGGLEVALAADFRFAAENATLGLPEIRLGIIPGAGGTQRLPRLVGLSRARELIYSGRHVGAGEALAIGLVDRVLPGAEVYATAVEEAGRWANGPTRALGAAKAAVNAAMQGDQTTGLRVEHDVFVPLFDTRDQKEGMRAFLDKREPGFEGR